MAKNITLTSDINAVAKAIYKANKAVFKEALKDVDNKAQYKPVDAIIKKALPAIKVKYNGDKFVPNKQVQQLVWAIVNRYNGVKPKNADVATLEI